MEALVVELVAYLIIFPLRVLGRLAGERGRTRAERAERWLLRHAWGIGASGITVNPETGHSGYYGGGASESIAAVKYEEEAQRNLEFNTKDLNRGQRYVEAGNQEMSRSEQMREAMLQAQREQHQRTEGERRSKSKRLG